MMACLQSGRPRTLMRRGCLWRRQAASTFAACRSNPPTSPQVLSSPTTKDFTNVMMFIFRQFDPVLPKTFKLEEEVGTRRQAAAAAPAAPACQGADKPAPKKLLWQEQRQR